MRHFHLYRFFAILLAIAALYQTPLAEDRIDPNVADKLNIRIVKRTSPTGKKQAAVAVSLPADIEGTLSIDEERVWREQLHATLTTDSTTQILTPDAINDSRTVTFTCDPIPTGHFKVNIPAGYFYIDFPVKEVSEIPATEKELSEMTAIGGWHVKGRKWDHKPILTIHDDDGIDYWAQQEGRDPSRTGGYFTTLYPVLAGLGLRGTLSLEGWRAGFTDSIPALNFNGRLMKRLQDEKNWEIQSHSMTAFLENNNWLVDSLNSTLADRILRESNYSGDTKNLTTSVFDIKTRRQYQVNSDKTEWLESPLKCIKPYILDYETGKTLMYNPTYPVDYQWGEWKHIADSLGIHSRAWVTYGPTSSHANVPLINEFLPCGFETDGENWYNLPPLRATSTRMMMEGQALKGYAGESSKDNTFNEEQYKFYLKKIDEAVSKNGWMVMGMHAYRPCWKNSLPGALVSEGGTYPDAWVDPLATADPDNLSLYPPAILGIKDWSEWYPCPGTRLEMLWKVLKYARDKGMLNLTSSEAYDVLGNKINLGYCIRGSQIGHDKVDHILGTRDIYPHYVVGANDEIYYYRGLASAPLERSFTLTNIDNHILSVEPERICLSGLHPGDLVAISDIEGHSYGLYKGKEILEIPIASIPGGIVIVTINGSSVKIKL